MVIDSVETLVNLVTKHRLLEPLQQDELARDLQGQYADPKKLARAMLEREWLTSMQINHLFQGRVNELIIGSYILRERLGESRAGQVYKARHLHLRRIAAVKIIREDLLADPNIVERFYQEIQATSSFHHPNIVHAYDAGPIGKTHFFAMEHIQGTDLWRLVKKAGSITVPQACEYISQTALALQQVHDRGLLHLDVKPGNLLVTRSAADTPAPSTTPSPTAPPSSKTFRDGLIKIRNLGLTALEDRTSSLFLKGRFRGDPDCRAPELADPSAKPDVRSELYSLGCTFYFLLTGQPPFSEGTPAEKMRRHQTEEPTAIELLRPEVPPGVQAVVNRLLAKNPDERFQRAAEVATALSQSNSGINLSVESPSSDSSGSSARRGITTFRRFLSAVGLRARRQAGNLVSAGSSLRLRTHKPARWKIAVSAVLALCFLIVVGSLLWRASGRKGKDGSDDSVQGIWEKLRERADDSKTDASQFREEVHSFRWKYPGTPQAAQAEALLARLSSPLDSLDGKNIGKAERAGLKDDLVAVLGSRGRHWSEADCVAFTPDGKLLASGGHDKLIRIWDVSTMEEWAVLQGHTARVSSLAFATDRMLASSGDDASVRLWDIGKAKQEAIDIKGHTGAVNAVAFSPTAKKLACGGADKIVRIWDLSDKAPKATALPAHGNVITALAFSNDGSMLASASADALVRVFDVATGQPKEPGVFKGHTGSVLSVAFAPDGTTLVSGGQDKTVRLWKLDGSAAPAPLVGHGALVRSVAFCSDGKTIASAGDNKTIILWNVAAPMPQQIVSIIAHANRIDAVAFSPDGKTLASCGEDTTVRLWNVAGTATNERAVYPGHYGAVTALAFSADLKSLASGGIDGTARVWDLTKAEPKERLALRGHPGVVTALKFIKDDRGLLTGCADGQVRSWDLTVASPRPDPAVPGTLATSSSSVAVSPDGRTMINAVNGKVTIWDTTTNKSRDWLTLPGGTPTTLLMAPDGRHLVVGNLNGTIYILRLPTSAARTK